MSFSFAEGQDLKSFFGKWRVVEIDNGVIYNYDKDKLIVPDSIAISLKGRQDSARVIKNFSSWASSCRNCIYEFSATGIYQELREDELRSEGSYTVDLKEQKIKANFKKDGVNKEVIYPYNWQGKYLIIFVPSFFIPYPIEIRLELIS